MPSKSQPLIPSGKSVSNGKRKLKQRAQSTTNVRMAKTVSKKKTERKVKDPLTELKREVASLRKKQVETNQYIDGEMTRLNVFIRESLNKIFTNISTAAREMCSLRKLVKGKETCAGGYHMDNIEDIEEELRRIISTTT